MSIRAKAQKAVQDHEDQLKKRVEASAVKAFGETPRPVVKVGERRYSVHLSDGITLAASLVDDHHGSYTAFTYEGNPVTDLLTLGKVLEAKK